MEPVPLLTAPFQHKSQQQWGGPFTGSSFFEGSKALPPTFQLLPPLMVMSGQPHNVDKNPAFKSHDNRVPALAFIWYLVCDFVPLVSLGLNSSFVKLANTALLSFKILVFYDPGQISLVEKSQSSFKI